MVAAVTARSSEIAVESADKATPPVRASELSVESGDKGTPSLRTSELAIEVAYRIPAGHTYSSEEAIEAGVKRLADISYQSQLAVEVAWHGRIANPNLIAWTFTLDDHDFYVLRLGDNTTLVYDLLSEKWVEWTSKDNGSWRPTVGMGWIGAESLATTYGTNIIAGDDSSGLLWFLDPTAAYDDSPYFGYDTQVPFDRIVTAQSLATGRTSTPCYAIFLSGDNYGLTATDFTPEVTLETSDDQGRTFFSHGTLTVTPDFQQELPYTWLSLGQIQAPGRIFRVTDNGVFARIDSIGMNNDDG